MIQVNLDVMLAKRKMSSGELAKKVGMTNANISVLKTGKAKAVRFSTLNEICKVLECQPGDIIKETSSCQLEVFLCLTFHDDPCIDPYGQ